MEIENGNVDIRDETPEEESQIIKPPKPPVLCNLNTLRHARPNVETHHRMV